jgi:hypothetical protein
MYSRAVSRKTWVKTLVLVLLAFFSLSVFVNDVPVKALTHPIINLQSPLDNVKYTSDSVNLQFSVDPNPDTSASICVDVLLDGNLVINSSSSISFDYILNGLTNGEHTIKITAVAFDYIEDSTFITYSTRETTKEISFTVNTGSGPNLIISGGSEFPVGDVKLMLSVNDNKANIWYRMDNGENITVPSESLFKFLSIYQFNITLQAVTKGEHTINVYSIDQMGNSKTESLTLKVGLQNTPKPAEPLQWDFSTSSPVIYLTGILIGTLLAGILVLFFVRFTKRKTPQKQK